MNRIPIARITLLLVWLQVLAGPQPAGAVTLEQLLARPSVTDIKLSPNGKYLAVKVFDGDQYLLHFFDREEVAPVGGFAFGGDKQVGEFHWANEERVVGTVLQSFQAEQPDFYGELFATNYDGRQAELLFGFRVPGAVGSRLRKKAAEEAWADIVDVLPEDDRHILISSTPWSRSRGARPEVKLLNIYTAVAKSGFLKSGYGHGSFYTDTKGKVRLMTSIDEDRKIHVETLTDDETGWITVPDSVCGSDMIPIAITDDDQSFYVLDNPGSDRTGLFRLALSGSGSDRVYVHDRVDISDVVMSADQRSVYAMRVDDGYPSYLIFSGAHEEANVFKSMLGTFPGHLVDIRSRTRDGKYWIVKVSTDVEPGAFYLYNQDENTLKLLFKSHPDVEPGELSAMQPISFKSFDGLEIHGYFTHAAGDPTRTEGTEGGGVAPMVVLVHGGPVARDYWGFDPIVQALSVNGYSVLQVNFRGSSGYGKAFERAGHRQWGDAVQRDIIEGTAWAIEEGLAESGRVCIMGSSFGAYSAVQSATLAPKLFACVVANAGIYDLPLMYTRGDIESLSFGEAYLDEQIGQDDDELYRYSPVNNIERLRAPLFLAHGKKDQRAPIKHAQNLRKALDRHGKQYQWFMKRREAHGFYDTGNQVEYLEAALGFLGDHLHAEGSGPGR